MQSHARVVVIGCGIGGLSAWGYRTQKNLAMVYVDPEFAPEGSEVEVSILGEMVSATINKLCVFDAENRIVRDVNC